MLLKSIDSERHLRVQDLKFGPVRAKKELMNILGNKRNVVETAKVLKALNYTEALIRQGYYKLEAQAHPLRVASLTLKLDPQVTTETVIIALLHNFFEKVKESAIEIKAIFSSRVEKLIRVLTVDRSKDWNLNYKERYYKKILRENRAVRIVKIMDKLDNLFLLCLNEDAQIRRKYIDEIEWYLLPIIKQDLPTLNYYFHALIVNCQRCGYLNLRE